MYTQKRSEYVPVTKPQEWHDSSEEHEVVGFTLEHLLQKDPCE